MSKILSVFNLTRSKQRNSQTRVTVEEREEKLMYLVNLFRLTFRTYHAYEQAIKKNKNISQDVKNFFNFHT